MRTLSPDLLELDAALMGLRRVWESPCLRQRFLERMGRDVEPALVRTLRAVERAGEEPGVGEVALWLGIDVSTASRLVDAGVAAGSVERRQSDRDRRRWLLRLTGQGADLLERADAVRAEILDELTAGWEPHEVASLADLLGRLARSYAEMERS